MRSKRYFIIAIILLVILGVFLTLGLLNSRRMMIALIKEEARSYLSIVASTQENSIFAEGQYEDEIIAKLISICHYVETSGIETSTLNRIKNNFDINSIMIYSRITKKLIASAGNPLNYSQNIPLVNEVITYDYFGIGQSKYMGFMYQTQKHIFQIEISAEEIQRFRQEFGINKVINQLSSNPAVEYLVLQDKKGIIFATPNIQTITKITDDSLLLRVSEENIEASRITTFEDKNILEIARPFIVNDQSYGIFRIGISLKSYYRHVRSTERQLILLFVILFGAGFILFYLFMKYQSYTDLKELFHKTLGAIEDGVLSVDKKGTITGVNDAFCNITSHDEKTLVTHRYSAIFHDDPFQIERCIKEKTKVVDEKVIFKRTVQFSTYPLIDDNKRVSGAISVIRDVTKLRQFEEEREETERLKFLGNLVANFAHEIKNPLNGLSIATQRLIKEFPSKDHEYMRLTSSIKKEIESLNKTLNDFLSLARPRIKQKEQFDVSLLLQDTIEVITEQIKIEGIELTCKIDEKIKLLGNMDDFKRAILNIFLNAIDAVKGIRDRKKTISVTLSKIGELIHLQIADNGKGMDRDELTRIFTPYFTTKKKGTGLGLYIAQRIVKDHSGEVKVNSEQGKGTTFDMFFKFG